MFEVEAKIAITRKDFQLLEERMKREGEYLGEKRNEDFYYENPKKSTIRIRKKGTSHSFDLKSRETRQGIEENIELEWELKDPGAWRKVLSKLKIKPQVRKTKKTKLFTFKGFHLELNEVRGLGHYLEIETIVSKRAEVTRAKRELIEIFNELGYTKKQFEPKRYLELLGHV
ncbi:MAG: class IV adenylate cyclase [Candidatus Peregrinibacteria bacterium]|nr:class IV adenylate cyclase [Candidatus Peregrinibacteria bacterium]